MPGLKQLEYFRNELSRLGEERDVTAEWGEVYEDLPLPSASAPQIPQLDVDNLLASLGGADYSAGTPAAGEQPVGESGGEERPSAEGAESGMPNFDDLLASLPLDVPESPAEEPSSEGRPPAPPSGAGMPEIPEMPVFDNVDVDSFSLPDDLLSGFASDIETARSAGPDESEPENLAGFEESLEPLESAEPLESTAAADTGADRFALPDFDTGFLEPAAGEPPSGEAAEDLSLEDLSMEGFGGGGEIPAEGADLAGGLESLLDETPSGPPEGASGEAAAVPGIADLSIPDLGEMDFTPSFEEGPEAGFLPEREEPASLSETDKFGEEFADFSIPADLAVSESNETPGSAGGETSGIDGFDGFSLDEDFLKSNIDSAGAEAEDFHIPGFSDFTAGPARPSLSEFPEGQALPRKSAKKEIPLEISEDDFRAFLGILSAFPLNLRMAVEEYLSGTTGTELQKMELVHNILGKAPLRKTARTLEGLLSRSIPIPKDFEKKTMEEYEQEKKSLRYVLLNRILPAATLFAIIAVLSACVIFLGYQFVFRPLAAESLYKRGYEAIEDARYTQAVSLFDEAVAVKEKKRWYFKYARAFRDKKQYISAEMMYERILNRFGNDKAGGLEYAEMLRTDLRNFEKAETILRRRILDTIVNDPDALLLLGDTYLDWAEENPSKYEEARVTYSTLIELYGSKDPYLARMMRYFIRTDNLKEVLPLKKHFMGKRAKIGASDLVELSGYLLGKQYEPIPGDEEYLQDQIEDVRALLERAVKADDTCPEAHYNMGRYFIYNYKNDLASTALSEALRLYDEAETMTPKRVLTHIDAWRLLGELRVEDKEYLRAGDLFAEGITLYEEQRRNRSVRQCPLVGKLYADYADIDYFISGDYDRALMNYTKSINELNDTPSIRYRIGYIDYQNQDYEKAMREFIMSYASVPGDRNLLYGFGNALFRRGDFFAAQGYYERLQEELEAERIRKGILLPQFRADHGDFVEHYMHASNNLAVTLDRIASRTGDSKKRARALSLFAESNRAWDALTRNPETLVRASGSNLAYLNIQNITHPRSDFVPEIYPDIPRTLENEKVLQQRADQ